MIFVMGGGEGVGSLSDIIIVNELYSKLTSVYNGLSEVLSFESRCGVSCFDLTDTDTSSSSSFESKHGPNHWININPIGAVSSMDMDIIAVVMICYAHVSISFSFSLLVSILFST
jgi:hypothetical protein